jgi:hypothetical protein
MIVYNLHRTTSTDKSTVTDRQIETLSTKLRPSRNGRFTSTLLTAHHTRDRNMPRLGRALNHLFPFFSNRSVVFLVKDCKSVVDVVLKSSDGKLLGAHQRNLEIPKDSPSLGQR